MNATKDPVTGLSPFDVYSPMNSSEFSLVEIPENITLENQSSLISLILELQTKFFKLLQDKHGDYLKKIKYKDHVDDYPNPGELVMIQYEHRPDKSCFRNYGPFLVHEVVEREGIPYAVLKDPNNLLKKPFMRALSECVFYNNDPRNLSPAEVAAKGSEFTIVEGMSFLVAWLGGAQSDELLATVRKLQALDDYILSKCAGGENQDLLELLDKRQRTEMKERIRNLLGEIRIRTWLPQVENLYIPHPIGDTVSELVQASPEEIFNQIRFVENKNTPAQMTRSKELVHKYLFLFELPNAASRW